MKIGIVCVVETRSEAWVESVHVHLSITVPRKLISVCHNICLPFSEAELSVRCKIYPRPYQI